MIGSLQTDVVLEFRFDQTRQRTVLHKRQAGGLCHLSKPYWDGDVLTVQLVNPTAGLFAGDKLSMTVEIDSGAQVALTSPSAARYHTMPEGRAEIQQNFSIGADAWLDYWPEIVIPQKDSDTCQTTRVTLEKGASMVFLDTLAPGRIAHGENAEFRRLETRFEIYQEGELLAKERCVLEPAVGKWPLEMPDWDACYYGAVWIAGAHSSAAIESLGESEWMGFSQLSTDLAVVRVIAPTSLLLRKEMQMLRAHLQQTIPLLATDFRKL